MNDDRRCPKCSTVMCEKFDERPGPRGVTLAVPNGQFSCMKCGYDPGGDSQKGKVNNG
jgi:ribosomal protein S27AE